MRVLVTGGAGFVGSHVVDRLRAAGIETRSFDVCADRRHTADGVELVVGDLMDRAALGAAVSGCDAVVHLAAAADADAVARQPADAERVNARGTLNVLEAARENGVRRVVYASTIWVYSDAGTSAADEETGLGLPRHLYTATKLAGEMYCRSYAELYGLEYTILRFGIPYGPRARPEAVIPTFVRKALAGEPLTIAGGGGQSRRFVYVQDLADGVVRALAPVARNRVYNLVGDTDVTIRDAAESVRAAVGDAEVVHTQGRSGDFAGVRVSGERAARELGWRATTPFATGVRRYVSWYREQVPDEPVPHAAEPAPEPRSVWALLQPVAGRARTAALVPCVAVVLVVFLEALSRAGATGADLRTVSITTLLGLTGYLALVLDPESGRERDLADVGWLTAGVLVLLALRWPHDVLRLAHSDVDLRVLGGMGVLYGAVVGVAARRLVRGGLRERMSDMRG